MRKFKISLLVLTSVFLGSEIMAQQQMGSENPYDWTPVIDAITWHESRGHSDAVNGIYVGILQIAPILVRECNSILKQRGKSERYTLDDRRNPEKSKEMFCLIMSKYNPENDIDKACRLWKGGLKYSIKNTQGFVNWVHRYIEQHKDDKNEKGL